MKFLVSLTSILAVSALPKAREINESVEHHPLVAASTDIFDDNPCKATLDAITKCHNSLEFPQCVEDHMGGDKLDSCKDLVDYDFKFWMSFCVDVTVAFGSQDCSAQVAAAEKCVTNCAAAGDLLSLK